MPFASYQSTVAALSELKGAYSDERRYVDLCLTFERKSTGEEIWTVGGRWDRHESRYLDETPPDLQAVVISLNENQIPVVRAFARHVEARAAGLPRKPFLLTGGNRRGGKSWVIVRLALALSIAIPGAIVRLVSPILENREELERYLREAAIPDWLDENARELSFGLPNGSKIRNISGSTETPLKSGEADLVIYNEAQMMPVDVFTLGAPAVIDKGGMVLFAGNPERRKGRKGIWFVRLWLAIEAGKYEHGEVYRLNRKDNQNADAATATQVFGAIQIVDPGAIAAEDLGIFREPGNFVYAEHFDERRNAVAKFPDVSPSLVTGEIIRARGIGDRRDVLCGADFQANYGNAGVEIVAVGDAKRPTWYVTRCLVREGDESYFLDDAFGIWTRERTLWIGDPSGAWQDAPHTKAGFRGRDSFQKFSERKWRILPPLEKRSDRGEFAAHPPVADCINLVNRLLDEGRLIVCQDEAGPVAEALQRCEYGGSRRRESLPSGVYAHLTDALRYVLYWATPRPKAHTAAPGKGAIQSIDIPRTGARVL